jgi:DNA polymerase III epsilon subunit-like protein
MSLASWLLEGSVNRSIPDWKGENVDQKLDKYVSIDIETTALDPENGQMIEFAAVVDRFDGEVDRLPAFRRLILPKDGIIRGTAFALAMNAQILYEIDQETKTLPNYGPNVCYACELGKQFRRWLDSMGFGYERPSIAGKNVAGFDFRFLRAETNFFEMVKPVHRALDPGPMFWDRELDGFGVPDTATCMKRAGLDPTVKHRAAEDARVVCRLIRFADKVGTFVEAEQVA